MADEQFEMNSSFTKLALTETRHKKKKKKKKAATKARGNKGDCLSSEGSTQTCLYIAEGKRPKRRVWQADQRYCSTYLWADRAREEMDVEGRFACQGPAFPRKLRPLL